MSRPLTIEQALEVLMVEYDRQYPDAAPFHRGSFEYESRKVLVACAEAGLAVSER